MIYLLSTSVLVPGKMAEYGEIAKEIVPLFPKVGMKQAASWHAYTGDVNTTYQLNVYNDLAEIEKVREAQRKNTEYQRISAKLNALRISQTYTILEPNAWSPMK